MAGLSFRTGGESHGPGCLAVVEGLPKGLALDLDFVNAQLARRQRGYGRGGRQKIELDRVDVLGGAYRDATTEAPLCLWIPNRDHRLAQMPQLTRPRPGHADLAGCLRHGDRDIRANLERASARETAARVAAGAIAQLLLREIGVEVLGHVVRIGDVSVGGARGAELVDSEAVRAARERVEASELGLIDTGQEAAMRAAIDAAVRDKDTLGGVVEVVAAGVPPGLGSFSQWDQRLDGRLAQALMSIQAVKAVEIGLGRRAGDLAGSKVHDPIEPDPDRGYRRSSNHAGGIEGGVTNGEPVVLRVTKKPISTLRRPLPSLDLETGEVSEAAFERSDICAVPACAVIAEAMTALVLADAASALFGGASLAAFVAGCHGHTERARAVVERPNRRPPALETP